jgi:O-antigen/teichoic acid export membrane protein
MQAIAVLPYYLSLANGNVRVNLQINIAAVVLITPLLILLVMKCGVIGAGISWIVMNLCTLPLYLHFIHRRFMPGELKRWCARGVISPILVALPCVLLGRWLMPHIESRVLTLGYIGFVWGVAVLMTAGTVAELRSAFVIQTCRVLGVSCGTE